MCCLLHIVVVLGVGSYVLISICAHNPFGANVAVDVVAVIQRADGYTAFRRCMCEFAFTDINADMGYAVAACIEEYEVARSDVVTRYSSSHLVLGPGLVRKVDSDFIKNIHRKPGAIKSVSRYSAGYVSCSDGFVDNLIHFGVCESASCSDGKDNGKAQ